MRTTSHGNTNGKPSYEFIHFKPPSSTTTLFHISEDYLIRSAIVAFLSSNIVPFVIDAKLSYALWKNLVATYENPSRARIMSLRESLSNMKKAEYNSITAALCAQETTVIFEELHEKLLDFEQNLVHSSSSTMVPITENFAAKPSPHNDRSRPNYASRPGNNSNQFAANNTRAQFDGKNNHRNRPHVTCQLCDKTGHQVK
ncbi:hypothetical protein CQW23_13333 [Capsicum baccatum]|uniref:Retrovirus-related Pol polyprotein from transposon TNT 1-94 n=1 Tax=Capsicum baccatum TaxID=33114 RepID=A0A2G2WV59_CAPBA|nr:hypothetical protein CQW23_13333 [Capsicum baccatum]